MRTSALFAALAVSASASAKLIVVTVGTNLVFNGSDFDASGVFQPQQIEAQPGDQIFFNFTAGNHSATRSTFDQPCVPISQHNTSVNGFNSDLRPTNNGTAITNYLVDIEKTMGSDTIWFYDINTCGNGGVGAINVNTSSWEPFDAYVRNAERLFGPHANETHESSTTRRPTNTGSGNSPQGTDTDGGDGVMRAASISAFAILAAGVALIV